jgi:GNAT superfamily N-acetyltransferase
MAIFCITTSNPEFQKLLAESGEKQGVFAMMVSKWMTENEVYDRYPTLQELGITAMDSIKPGVQELFESNPELANAVYEALGLINTSEIQLDGPKFNPDNYEAISYSVKINGEYAGVVSVDKDGYISSSIGMAGVELEKEFQGKGYGTKVYIALAEQLAKEGKTLKSEAFGKEDINKSANRVWKSLLNKGYAVDKGSYFEIQLKNKQQALQLYSQYLDSVFPDSKVKDIVYHGSDTTFDGFLEDNLNYFGTKEIAKGYGKNLYPVLIEINKPYYEDGGNLSNQSYEDLYDKLDESGSDGFISNGKNLFVPKTEEQIHILGSKQDIEGFKEFVGNVEDVATDIGLDMSSDEAKAFNSLVNDGTISIKCE